MPDPNDKEISTGEGGVRNNDVEGNAVIHKLNVELVARVYQMTKMA